MKLFNLDSFYTIVEESESPAFITLSASGGYRRCASLVEASKFKDKENAFAAVKGVEKLKVYIVELLTKTSLKGDKFNELWSWSPIDK